MDNKNVKVLLYSGGMDSWLIDKLWKPDVKIFFDTGVDYDIVEKQLLPKDVIIFPLPISQFELHDAKHTLPLRNMLFLEIASYYGNEICIGAVNGDKHYDKQPKFLNDLQTILNSLYDEVGVLTGIPKQVKIVAPYNTYTKYDLLNMYLKNGGDINKAWEQSFSCYTPINQKPCLNCRACFRKCVPFVLLGKTFTDDEKSRIKQFVNNYVIPNINTFYNDNEEYNTQTDKAIEVIKQW